MNNEFNNNLNVETNNIETNSNEINMQSSNLNNNFDVVNSLNNQQPMVQGVTATNSNANGLSKKSPVLGIIIAIIVIGLVGSIFTFMPKKVSSTSSELSVNMVKMGDKVVSLKKGDELTVDGWNAPVEVILNEKELEGKNTPELYNGVTLGTHVKDVINKFNIKSGYAILNMEVSTEEHDGTTDIVEKSFKNYNSIPKDFLDCAIVFGYNKVNNEWQMVKEDNIEDADIIYYIDINGFNDETYDLNEVIMFIIKYNK